MLKDSENARLLVVFLAIMQIFLLTEDGLSVSVGHSGDRPIARQGNWPQELMDAVDIDARVYSLSGNGD